MRLGAGPINPVDCPRRRRSVINAAPSLMVRKTLLPHNTSLPPSPLQVTLSLSLFLPLFPVRVAGKRNLGAKDAAPLPPPVRYTIALVAPSLAVSRFEPKKVGSRGATRSTSPPTRFEELTWGLPDLCLLLFLTAVFTSGGRKLTSDAKSLLWVASSG